MPIQFSPPTVRQRLTVLALAASLATTAVPAIAQAQSDGTDADISEISADCIIQRADTLPVETSATPELPVDGEPIATPDVEATPIASPVASPVIPIASPAASPVASPVADAATPAAEATPADPNVQVAKDRLFHPVDVLQRA